MDGAVFPLHARELPRVEQGFVGGHGTSQLVFAGLFHLVLFWLLWDAHFLFDVEFFETFVSQQIGLCVLLEWKTLSPLVDHQHVLLDPRTSDFRL